MTFTNGFSSRGEPTWTARATTSFSLPSSPSIKTGEDVGAPIEMRGKRPPHRGRAVARDLAEVDRVALLTLEVAGVVGELLAEAAVLAHGREGDDRLPQDDRELLRVPGLLHVAIDGARVHGVDEDREIGVGGEQDADGVGPPLLGLLEKLDAVHPGHPLVAHDDGRIDALERLQRLGPAERVVQRERFSEREADGVEVVLFVVDDEDVELSVREVAHA